MMTIGQNKLNNSPISQLTYHIKITIETIEALQFGHKPQNTIFCLANQEIKIKYNDIVIQKALDPTANLDILWKTSLLFGFSRPAWSGMMQFVHRGNHPGQSSVTFLPMIDMSSVQVTLLASSPH